MTKKIILMIFTVLFLFSCSSNKNQGANNKETVESIEKDLAYNIDEKWMSRVKEIVDWAYEEGMYVIINMHHDNCSKANFESVVGFYPSEECKAESIKYVTRIWEQISETFNNDYDQHLIFEVMNEPRLKDHAHEWNYNAFCKECQDAMKIVLEMNQAALDTIRKSGGNNGSRLVVVPSLVASPDSAFSALFKMPTDTAENALALSVHMYTPYEFAMGVPNGDVFLDSYKSTLDSYFSRLNTKFVSKGVPVIIGEMGATNKDNLSERAKWFSFFIQHARKYGMAACVWDNGSNSPSKTESERYGYYNRTKQEWYFPLLMDIALKASGSQIENTEADSYIDSSFVVDFEPQNRAQEIVYDMGFGWNLGNTLDATHWNELQNGGLETETGWGQPKTTQEMIQGLKALGVKTIRIPISWHNHIEN